MGYFGTLANALIGRPMEAVTYGPGEGVAGERAGGWLMRVLGLKTHSSKHVSEFGALHLPVVWACNNRIANPIARFPLKIMQPKRSGSGSIEVTQHPMSSSLGLRPNERMSSRTLRKTCQTHALLWGNGYNEIQRNNAGEAIGLWPLLPWNTKPRIEDGDLIYRTTIDGQSYRLEKDDVVHIMDLSTDGYEGHSQIAMAREALGMALAMEEFGAKFFANDAKSGGFLQHPGRLSAQAQNNLGGDADKRTDPGARQERQGGLDNAHRVKVLEEGMKFIPTMIPPEDSQFLGSREFQIAEIARIYDVPLILLQSHEKTTSWGSGIEQLMIGFIRQTVAPWIGAWEQELNYKLFTTREREQGLFVKFNMNEYLRGDSAARAAFYREMFSVGAMAPNTICDLEDIDGAGPDGNERFVPANFVTLSRAVNPPPPPAGAQVTEQIRKTA